MKHSPYGPVVHNRILERGLNWIDGKKGSGFLCSAGYVERNLSAAAKRIGTKWGNYVYFEEGNGADVVFLEIERAQNMLRSSEYVKKTLMDRLSETFPNYLEHRERASKISADEDKRRFAVEDLKQRTKKVSVKPSKEGTVKIKGVDGKIQEVSQEKWDEIVATLGNSEQPEHQVV